MSDPFNALDPCSVISQGRGSAPPFSATAQSWAAWGGGERCGFARPDPNARDPNARAAESL